MSVANIYTNNKQTITVVEKRDNVYIEGIKLFNLHRYLKTMYKASAFMEKFLTFNINNGWFNATSCAIHKFFIPELVFILQRAVRDYYAPANFTAVCNAVIENTWYKNTQTEMTTEVDMRAVLNAKRKPLPYQQEFIEKIYYQKKTQFQLKGYLLAFEPGLGKTTTSILLSEGLHKKHVIVIAPKSVVKNVWPTEIEETLDNKKIWIIDDNINNITPETNFVIINYEAIDKIIDRVNKVFDKSSTMIVVDECHNFKDIKSQRTNSLINLATLMECKDILLMSGTPIKALGVECMPIFKLLDNFYDAKVEDSLKEFCRYPKIMNELLHNRLGIMMFRKLKEEVLTLPNKIEEDISIKLTNGDEYTLEIVKQKARAFYEERLTYYKQHKKEFEKDFLDCLAYFEDHCLAPNEYAEYSEYRKKVKIIREMNIKSGFGLGGNLGIMIKEVNDYDKQVIVPRLPNDLKKKFRNSKTVYKYVTLKVTGEVIGILINDLRKKMTSQLIGTEVINVIKHAKKKTILFSNYSDSLVEAVNKCKANGLKPMLIDGSNSTEAKTLVAKFKQDDSINPLVASIKVMSTGHTINEANTVVFLNVPFRSVDYEQARDRCYRIGQDTDVYIYRLVLDTGKDPNLSTRMQDILAWSKDQFGQIVDGADSSDEMISEILKIQDESIFGASNRLVEFIKSVIKI